MCSTVRAPLLLTVVILVSELYIATGNVFHIVTSLDNPCPGEFDGIPCVTLQQYVSNPSIDKNVTLLFENGSHSLGSSLSVSQGMAYTLSGSQVEIYCSAEASVSFASIHEVRLNGIGFSGCHVGISFAAIRALTIEWCAFRNSVSGFAYDPDGNNPPINLTDIASGYIKNSVFANNTNSNAHGFGGTLYISGSRLVISDSEFVGNTARAAGGAIYATGTLESIYDMLLTIHNSTFSDNKGTSRYFLHGGGAIYVQNVYRNRIRTSLNVSTSTFKNNFVPTYGGRIYYRGSEEAIIENSYFLNNTVITYNGGAIYSLAIVTLSGSNFTNNVAIEGGAIFVNNASVITDCLFLNNTARTYGGALYSDGTNSSIVVSGSSFIHNKAISHGGGAIYSNSRYANISLESSTFNLNSASFCSVLDVDEFYHFSVSVTESSFKQNRASAQHNAIGGGVACIRNASVDILRSNFSYNHGSLHGGVFYIDESDVYVDDSLFVNNSATMDGGVFYTYVHASTYNIRRSQFSYNSAGDDGGVLYIGRLKSQISIYNSVFNFNRAAVRGGVVATVASSSLHMNDSNVFNNSASYGDVISACNSGSVMVDESLAVAADPGNPLCTVYDGEITRFNITAEAVIILPNNVVEQPTTDYVMPSMASKFQSFTTSLTSTASISVTTKNDPTTDKDEPTKSTLDARIQLHIVTGLVSVLLVMVIVIIIALIGIVIAINIRKRRTKTIETVNPDTIVNPDTTYEPIPETVNADRMYEPMS